MRPGRSTSCRIARMVTLLPQPDRHDAQHLARHDVEASAVDARTSPSSRANDTA